MQITLGATTTLAELSQVREFLKITDTNDDTLLTNLINRATAVIEHHCRRRLLERTYTGWKVDGDGDLELWLPEWPVSSVTSVKIDGTVISDYTLYDNMYLYRELGWSANDYRGIEVDFVAGYSAEQGAAFPLPDDLVQACIMLVEWWYKRNVAAFSEVYGEDNVVVKPENFPGHVQELIAPYRRLVVGAV